MDFSRVSDPVDRSHDQYPLTYVPGSFLRWDSYYERTRSDTFSPILFIYFLFMHFVVVSLLICPLVLVM